MSILLCLEGEWIAGETEALVQELINENSCPGRDLVTFVPIVTSVGLAGYVVWQALRPKIGLVNPDIEKNVEKVVNSMDIEDIGESIAFCRCWRSKKFPLCDGSHNTHNKKTGDNVGPMCLKRNK